MSSAGFIIQCKTITIYNESFHSYGHLNSSAYLILVLKNAKVQNTRESIFSCQGEFGYKVQKLSTIYPRMHTCSIGVTAHTSGLVFQRRFPPLLRLRHIPQIININMSSSGCHNETMPDQRKRVYTLRLWICSNKSALLPTGTSRIPTFQGFVPTTSDQLPCHDITK